MVILTTGHLTAPRKDDDSRDLFFASTECTLYFDFILCTRTFNGFCATCSHRLWNGTRKNPRFPAEKPLVFLNSGSVGTAIANEVSVILTSLSILFLDRWLGQTARGRLEDKGSRSLEVSTGHAHRQPAAPVPLCLRTVPIRSSIETGFARRFAFCELLLGKVKASFVHRPSF